MILRLRTRGLRNLQIAHVCYTISRLRTRVTQYVQSQDSENAQRNLEIAEILRLCGTYIINIIHRSIGHPIIRRPEEALDIQSELIVINVMVHLPHE